MEPKLYKQSMFNKLLHDLSSTCNPINSWQHENMSNVEGSAAINSEVHSAKEKTFDTAKSLSSLPSCSQQILIRLHPYICFTVTCHVLLK